MSAEDETKRVCRYCGKPATRVIVWEGAVYGIDACADCAGGIPFRGSGWTKDPLGLIPNYRRKKDNSR